MEKREGLRIRRTVVEERHETHCPAENDQQFRFWRAEVAMRPHIAAGLDRIQHPLKRVCFSAMQRKYFPLSRVALRLLAFDPDDLWRYGKSSFVP